MVDNVAGQFGFGFGQSSFIWLIWIAIIALVIFLFCTPGFGFC